MQNETITIRYSLFPIRHLYANYVYIPEFVSITGLRIKNPEFVGNDCITMLDLAGNLRVIPISDIVSPQQKDNNTRQHQTITSAANDVLFEWEVRSRTKSTVRYKVTFNGKLWNCSCAGFSYRQTCNHVIRCKNEWKDELIIN